MKDYPISPTILYDLTAVGDAYVDFRAVDTPLPEAVNFQRQVAGVAALTTVYTSLFGDKACIVASVGADAMGTFIQNTLRQYRVNVHGLQFSREFQTTTLFSSLTNGIHQSLYYRLADWQLHNTRDHVTLAQGSRIVFGSGFSLWKHPARHSIFEVLRLSKKLNLTTVLHPQYDPVMWRDHDDAIMTIKKTLQFTDIATPTVEDATHLFGKMLREDYVKKYLDLGAKSVILTQGSEGCLVSDGSKIIKVPAVDVEAVVDPSGAVEAWHAGLFYALNAGKEMAHAAYFANAVAAYVVQKPGSLVHVPPPNDLCERMTGRSFSDL